MIQSTSRDSRSLYQGIEAPPHVEYEAKVLSLLSSIDSIECFVKRSQRLIRQIEIRKSIVDKGKAVLDSISNIRHICKKSHVMARQLRNRHDGRPTLEIGDEYDVKDLLHFASYTV